MANLALRSPQYKTAVANTGTPLSTKLTITIDTVLRYTLVKSTSLNENMLWEISQLCRDYLEANTFINTTIDIVSVITSHASTDGSGAALTTDTFTDKGFDGYGTFMEGANPTVPFGSVPTWAIAPNDSGDFYVYYPYNYQGYVPIISSTSATSYFKFGSTDTIVQGSAAGVDLNIVRVDCSKYGNGSKIKFVNKYGMIQELFFFTKSVENVSKKQETFNRNIVSATGTYNTRQHTKPVYNTTASERVSLSSGYYPEWANEWFEQLMLSEQVWYVESPVPTNPATDVDIPVNVSTASFTKKTSVNDKLIEYTFEFDMSFDYINNVR